MTNNIGKITSIQLLRAIAIILVIHCHTLDYQSYIKAYCYQSHFFYLQDFGAVGVDLFFVLSGFIITIISRRYSQTGNGVYFFVKRVIRVIPLYWLVSFLSAILTRIEFRHTPPIEEIINTIIVFMLPAFKAPVLFQGWTLSFEMLFYTVIFITMMMNSNKYLWHASLLFLVCISLNYIGGRHFYPLNFWGNGLMLEFLMGVIAGQVYLFSKNFKARSGFWVLLIGIGGLLFSIVNGFGDISEMQVILNGALSLKRSLLWGVPCALLVTGVIMLHKAIPLRVHPVWIAIGDASFSLYLIHYMLLHFMYEAWKLFNIQKVIQGDLLVIISMIITLVIGWIFYKWVEVPLLNRLNMFANKFKTKVYL